MLAWRGGRRKKCSAVHGILKGFSAVEPKRFSHGARTPCGFATGWTNDAALNINWPDSPAGISGEETVEQTIVLLCLELSRSVIFPFLFCCCFPESYIFEEFILPVLGFLVHACSPTVALSTLHTIFGRSSGRNGRNRWNSTCEWKYNLHCLRWPYIPYYPRLEDFYVKTQTNMRFSRYQCHITNVCLVIIYDLMIHFCKVKELMSFKKYI